MPDFARTFRVLVVAEGKRAAAWVEAIQSHGWTAMASWGTAVADDARALLPQAALIDASQVEEAAQAGLAVRRHGVYNAVLLYVTADEGLRSKVRSRVPVPTFVTDKQYMAALWDLPAARATRR